MHVMVVLGWWLVWLVWSGVGFVASAQEGRPVKPVVTISGDSGFIDRDAEVELVIDGSEIGMTLPGAVAMGCDGLVYVSDIPFSNLPDSLTERGTRRAGVIWRYDPKTDEVHVFRSPSGMTNGLVFNADCQLLAAEGADLGGRRITLTNMQTQTAEIVAGQFEEKPFNAPNDLVLDRQGRLYFTDVRYVGHEPYHQDHNAVYRVDPDGHIERLIDDLPRPNGIGISPDGRTLYVANFGGALLSDSLWAYTLNDDGTVSLPRMIVDFHPERGVDGFSVDTDGNIWASVHDRTRPGIYAFTPQGVEKVYIRIKKPWNTGFGRGDQRHILYFTAGRNVYRVAVNKQGLHVPSAQPSDRPDEAPLDRQSK